MAVEREGISILMHQSQILDVLSHPKPVPPDVLPAEQTASVFPSQKPLFILAPPCVLYSACNLKENTSRIQLLLITVT